MADRIDASSLTERARQREDEGDDDGAIADLEQAAALAEDSGDASTEVAARAGLVRVHFAAGHTRDVDDQLERIAAALRPSVAPTARAEALTEWGLVSIERGEDARDTLDEALALVAGARDHPDAGRIEVRALMYRAHGERLRGDYVAARATLERALATAETALGPDSQAMAEVLNAQGVLGKFSGEFDVAERAYARAARIVESRHGAEHRDMAAIYHNLAGLAHAPRLHAATHITMDFIGSSAAGESKTPASAPARQRAGDASRARGRAQVRAGGVAGARLRFMVDNRR